MLHLWACLTTFTKRFSEHEPAPSTRLYTDPELRQDIMASVSNAMTQAQVEAKFGIDVVSDASGGGTQWDLGPGGNGFYRGLAALVKRDEQEHMAVRREMVQYVIDMTEGEWDAVYAEWIEGGKDALLELIRGDHLSTDEREILTMVVEGVYNRGLEISRGNADDPADWEIIVEASPHLMQPSFRLVLVSDNPGAQHYYALFNEEASPGPARPAAALPGKIIDELLKTFDAGHGKPMELKKYTNKQLLATLSTLAPKTKSKGLNKASLIEALRPLLEQRPQESNDEMELGPRLASSSSEFTDEEEDEGDAGEVI